MPTLVVLTLLPLAVIACQVALGLSGTVGYVPYKLAFIVPPLIYCRLKGISVTRDLLKFHNWRNGLGTALALGIGAAAIFWGVYLFWGKYLIDVTEILEKVEKQFGVTKQTVMFVAPFTIIANSLLEEFFYRGFTFSQLVRKNRFIGYLLPAIAFTVQHMLFIYHWAGWFSLSLAVIGLLAFALVLEWLYERYDTIVSPWLAHACGDVAMMTITIHMLS